MSIEDGDREPEDMPAEYLRNHGRRVSSDRQRYAEIYVLLNGRMAGPDEICVDWGLSRVSVKGRHKLSTPAIEFMHRIGSLRVENADEMQ